MCEGVMANRVPPRAVLVSESTVKLPSSHIRIELANQR